MIRKNTIMNLILAWPSKSPSIMSKTPGRPHDGVKQLEMVLGIDLHGVLIAGSIRHGGYIFRLLNAYCCFSDPLHSRCDACLARCAQCAKVGHGGLVMCHSHGCSACLHASSPQTQTRHADPSLFPLGQHHTKSPRPSEAAVGLALFVSPFGSFFASPVEYFVRCCVCARALLRRQ